VFTRVQVAAIDGVTADRQRLDERELLHAQLA
jgi:hypothetical protein